MAEKKENEQKKISAPDQVKTKDQGGKKTSGVKFSLRWKFSLAIIALVAMIIASITVYIVWREGELLKSQVYQFVTREVIHLANTAQQAIGVDDFAMIAAMDDLKSVEYRKNQDRGNTTGSQGGISYFKYAYILNKGEAIIRSFDKRDESRSPGEVLNDGVDRDIDKRAGLLSKRAETEKMEYDEVKVIISPDTQDKRGEIYDFSSVLIDKLSKKKLGTVIIGLSDIVIRIEKENLLKVIIPISLVFLGISIVGSILLASVTIKPIQELSRGAVIIGRGNLDYHIDIHTKDELGQLAREFNVMTAQIRDAKDKEIESRILQEQMDMAKDIQEGLNPMGFYDKGGIQIKGYTKAAKGVGGDYFDYIDVDENRVGALISDVAGKGVPASLVMVMIRTVFTTYIARKDVDCAKVTSAINNALSADFAIDKFATLFFMMYDRRTEELSFSNAGHGPLFLYRSGLNACSVTKVDGVPIGVMEGAEYKQAKLKLDPGDMAVLFTDGVTEMRNIHKDEFTIKRVHQFILDNNTMNADEFVQKLVDEVEAFRGEAPPHDDCTMLVFKKVS